MEKVRIENESLSVVLHVPDIGKGFYRGTRFDWSGVFDAIMYKGCNYSDIWFEGYSPLNHDAVCGPVDEFGAVGYDDALPGELFLKLGVGLLMRPDNLPYDRFRLYEIADPGEWTIVRGADSVKFRHVLSSCEDYSCDYEKEISLTGRDSFCIRHKIHNKGRRDLCTDVYNHNFFTLGLLSVSQGRHVVFPFSPEADWRDDYDHVYLTEDGIRFSAPNDKVRSVYTGNLHETGKGFDGSPNSFDVLEESTGRGVQSRCDIPMTKAVFWANPKIACVEPYIDLCIQPGEVFEYSISYRLL